MQQKTIYNYGSWHFFNGICMLAPHFSSKSLTETQERALNYICEVTLKTNHPPTLRELCEFMGYSAIGSAQDLAKSLSKKGFLQPNSKQAARMTLLPSEQALNLFDEHQQAQLATDSLLIPCLGQVPAGNPLEAINHKVGDLVVSYAMLPKPKPKPQQLFALRAKGLSMINAGILDGDWMVVKSTNQADSGQLVIARLDDDATVKRLMRDAKNGWYLKPENPDFKNIYASDRPFTIMGQVISIQRFI